MRKLFWLLVAATTAIIASGVYLMSQKAADDDTYSSAATGIANPWVNVDRKTMSKENVNGVVVDEKYEPVYLYNDSIGMAETLFTDPATGIEWCVRTQKTDKAEDISGMYYSFTDDNNGYDEVIEVNGVAYNQLCCKSGEENVYVAYGYKDGYTICYSCISKENNITVPVIK